MSTPLSPRARRILTWSPAAVLVLTLAAASPALIHRFGSDATVIAVNSELARSITILGAGDTLVHPPLWTQAAEDAKARRKPGYDFDPVFADLKGVVSTADLALCHMEAPMGPGIPKDFPRFNAPIQLAGALHKIGFDGCSTASNHSLDQGENGVVSNIEALNRAHLNHTGTFRTLAESQEVNLYHVKDVLVGHLSYAYGLNPGTAMPPAKPWMANLIDIPKILADAHRLKGAGANIVVVSLHWGVERSHNPNSQQLNGAKALLASPDIDLLIGHHSHVVQPMEQINGKWVAYGVGNLVARHDFPIPDNKEGILPRFTFSEVSAGKWQVTRAEAIPIWLSLEPRIKIINVPDAMARMATVDARRSKYANAMNRITGYLDRRGAQSQGLRIVTSVG